MRIKLQEVAPQKQQLFDTYEQPVQSYNPEHALKRLCDQYRLGFDSNKQSEASIQQHGRFRTIDSDNPEGKGSLPKKFKVIKTPSNKSVSFKPIGNSYS
jgi:hypothetical protein